MTTPPPDGEQPPPPEPVAPGPAIPGPATPGPAAPGAAAAYGTAGYPQASWQPPVVRPPLAARQKRGAAIAGIVGFNLLSLGFGMFIAPIALAAVGGILRFVVNQARRTSPGSLGDIRQLERFLDMVDLNAWTVPLIIIGVLGLVIMAVAIFASGRILRVHGVNRPWPVTWAGAGIAIVASWVVGWVGGVVVQIVSAIMSSSGVNTGAVVGVTIGLSVLVAIVTNSVIGWLAWWWMAHVMRAPAR